MVEYFQRHHQHRWWKRPNPEKSHGRVRLQFDQDDPYVIWFDEAIRNAPAEFDRFGLFNICRYGTSQTVYFSDLTLNGQKIDLSNDPHWLGVNNRASWIEPDFQSMNDFGWARTNWAGAAPGEIGGLLWLTEPQDPGFGYYADEVGDLTLEDPIEFAGHMCFVNGMTDASTYFGYFNKEAFMRPFAEGENQLAFPMPSMMGIGINDSTSVGYYFDPMVSAADRTSTKDHSVGSIIPDRKPRPFTFKYDPKANGGVGRVIYTFDGKEGGFNLTPDQRKAGARLDHFGLITVRRGGNSVELYLDDLTYTARRDPAAPPPRHKQMLTERRYPTESAGRRF